MMVRPYLLDPEHLRRRREAHTATAERTRLGIAALIAIEAAQHHGASAPIPRPRRSGSLPLGVAA